VDIREVIIVINKYRITHNNTLLDAKKTVKHRSGEMATILQEWVIIPEEHENHVCAVKQHCKRPNYVHVKVIRANHLVLQGLYRQHQKIVSKMQQWTQ